MTSIRRLLSSVYRPSIFYSLLLFIAVVMEYPINFSLSHVFHGQSLIYSPSFTPWIIGKLRYSGYD
jgi:hypothetical protein